MPKESPFLTVIEVCQRAGICRARLNELRAEGRGPKETRVGRRVLFRRSDLERWIMQRKRVKLASEHRIWLAALRKREAAEAAPRSADGAPSSNEGGVQ